MRAQLRDDRGMVTAFVACFSVALIAVVGLVVDGGFILAAHRHAFDDADAAARSGAQAVDEATLRSGGPVTLNPARAKQLAEDQLSAEGATGTVEVSGDSVTVHVTRTQSLSILGFAGLGPVTVHGTGTAHAIRGVRTGGD
jgi:uncharacterized membrane protein